MKTLKGVITYEFGPLSFIPVISIKLDGGHFLFANMAVPWGASQKS